jgi:hypothetical protein
MSVLISNPGDGHLSTTKVLPFGATLSLSHPSQSLQTRQDEGFGTAVIFSPANGSMLASAWIKSSIDCTALPLEEEIFGAESKVVPKVSEENEAGGHRCAVRR